MQICKYMHPKGCTVIVSSGWKKYAHMWNDQVN